MLGLQIKESKKKFFLLRLFCEGGRITCFNSMLVHIKLLISTMVNCSRQIFNYWLFQIDSRIIITNSLETISLTLCNFRKLNPLTENKRVCSFTVTYNVDSIILMTVINASYIYLNIITSIKCHQLEYTNQSCLGYLLFLFLKFRELNSVLFPYLQFDQK